MSDTTTQVPNPGSQEAQRQGCTCPVIDNHYGAGRPGGLYWYTAGCPVHWPDAKG